MHDTNARSIVLRPFLLIFLLTLLIAPVGLCQSTKENADFKLAVNLYNDSLFDLASEQLKQFIAAYPSTSQGIEARFYLGLTQLKLKAFDDARLTFQTFALTYQDNPRAPEAWWNVGESYVALKNYKEASLAFERVKVFHPKHKSAPDALLRAARYFTIAGERENARRVLRVILQEYSTSAPVSEARTQLARMYFEDGNLDQALGELKRVVDGDPSSEAKAQALLTLGNINQATGKLDEAEAQYREILTKFKSTGAVASAYVSLGRLLAGTGKYIEAVDAYKKAVTVKPGSDSLLLRDALLGTGDALAALKDYPNAVTAYERFLSASPRDERAPAVLWKIADAASRGKNFRRSNDACTQLLNADVPPALRKRAMLRLGENSLEQNSPAAAAQRYNTYIDQYPDDPATPGVQYRLASLTEQQLNDPRKAATWFELLIARNLQSPLVDDALMGCARCYEELKEFDRALASYRELARKYPASEYREEADRHIWRIATFDAKDKDAGVEQLALLLGDVVVEKDRATLALRLGGIYFDDLKNYRAAAVQFSNALAGGIRGADSARALYTRMKCYAYLRHDDPGITQVLTEDCLSFARAFPADARSFEAARLFFETKAGSLRDAHTAYGETLALLPALATRPEKLELLATIGRLLEEADSNAAAVAVYEEVARGNPSPATAENAAFHRVLLLQKMGLADSSLGAAEAYLSAYPAGPHAAAMLATDAALSVRNGRAARAAELYQRLLNDFWYTKLAGSAERSLADAFAATGNYPAAIGVYQRILQAEESNPLSTDEADPSLLLALGQAYHHDGKDAEAKKCLLGLLAREQTGETAGKAFLILGLIARDEGSLDNAAAYFRRAESAAPGMGATRDIADLLFERGDYADAIKQFTELSRTSTSDTDRQFYAAHVIIARLRLSGPPSVNEAIAAFAKTHRNATEDLALFELEKGNYYFTAEDYARALKSFQTVASKYEETSSLPAAQYWIAKTLEATDKPQEAVRQLETLIKDHPAAEIAPRAYLTLGNIAYNAERWDEAIRNYKSVLDHAGADPAILPMALSNLIETYDAAGAYDAALTLTRKYLEQYPNSDDAFDKKIKIGILYDRLGYYDQAALHLQSLLDEAGSDLEGEIRYYIADANFNKGDYQQAILDFLKIPYLVTKKGKLDWTANSLYMSGRSYEKMGRYDQALSMYQQILDRPGIDPTYKAAARKEIDRVRLVVKEKPR